MNFYFCENCGKRITDEEGRNKGMKGWYCPDCSSGVTTISISATTEEQARELLIKHNLYRPAPVNNARKPSRIGLPARPSPGGHAPVPPKPAPQPKDARKSLLIAGAAGAIVIAGLLLMIFKSSSSPAPVGAPVQPTPATTDIAPALPSRSGPELGNEKSPPAPKSPTNERDVLIAKLKEANPGFDGTAEINPTGPISRVRLHSKEVVDISPLKGLSLVLVTLAKTSVTDLSPLAGQPLQSLDINHTAIADLSPLKDCPLRSLRADHTPIADLTPLQGMKQLGTLNLESTAVTNVAPLRGLPLQNLSLMGSQVKDLSPLKDTPLTNLTCNPVRSPDVAMLKQMPTLLTINFRSAKEFWQKHEKK